MNYSRLSTQIDVNGVFKKFRTDFEAVLKMYLKEIKLPKLQYFQSQNILLELHNRISEFTLRGGKRIRPFIMLISYEGYGGKDTKKFLKTCCSIELLQSFLLIYDDIMDSSDLRRGKDSFHKIYEKDYLFMNVKNKKHTALSIALLGGFIAMTYGLDLLLKSSFSSGKKIQAIDYYLKTIFSEGYGQLMDLYTPFLKKVDKQFLKIMNNLKTAKYTFEAPLCLGAILNGCNKHELKLLISLSNYLGEIFQIRDDILDIFGSSAEKKLGVDIMNGKKNLLVLKLLEYAKNVKDIKLKNLLKQNKISKSGLKFIQKSINTSKIMDSIKEETKILKNKALNILNKTSMEKYSKDILYSFLNQYFVN